MITPIRSEAISVSFPPNIAVPPDVLIQEMKPYVEQALEHIKGAIRERMPVGATGDLRRSVFRKVELHDDSISGEVYVPEGLKAAKYAYFVEFGRRAGGLPPYRIGTPLYQWVKVKMTSAAFKEKGKRAYIGDKTIERVSYLIARRIALRGTKPQHPMDLGFAQAYPRAAEIIDFGIQTVTAKWT
jgi:hypothetical protein